MAGCAARTISARASGAFHQKRGLRAAELVEIGIELLSFAPKFNGLAQKCTLNQEVRIGLADLVSLAAEITGDAERVG
jgi:hypothetical protein